MEIYTIYGNGIVLYKGEIKRLLNAPLPLTSQNLKERNYVN